MDSSALTSAIAEIAEGAYAVGVSGGADSVAVLHLLRHERPDLGLHVAHLDHETRAGESAKDAEFVRELSNRWGLPHTIGRRSEVEAAMRHLPANRSARFRVVRFALFRKVVDEHGLAGVILAHHADDQAETVLHRLLRGSHVPNLVGMMGEAVVGGVRVYRPMLGVRRSELREYLTAVEQPWREDASNESRDYLRNRLRVVLGRCPGLAESLIGVHESMAELREWVRRSAPTLADAFTTGTLDGIPELLAHEAGRKWLAARGAPKDQITPDVVGRLVEMAADAATPAKQQFPGGMVVRRRRGMVFVEA